MSTENSKSEPKEIKKLSPSRIESLNTCSWSFWTSYHLGIQDGGNLGSDTGSALHRAAEVLLLGRKRHEAKVKKIIEENDLLAVPSVDRYLKLLCRKEGRNYSDQCLNKDRSGIITIAEYVRPMLVTALKADFYGEEGEEIRAELSHEIEYRDDAKGIYFIIRGIIDKIFVTKNKRGTVTKARIVDYKSSRSKFEVSKVNSGSQTLIYKIFARDLFKKVKDISMEYIFLQFPKNPTMKSSDVDDEVLEGYKYYLSAIFHKINNFELADAYENFAAHNGGHFLCGKPGEKQDIRCPKTKKKTATKFDKWCCPVREPFEYFELSKSCGKIVRTAKKQEDLNLTQAENMSIIAGDLKLEKKFYGGCPAWHPENYQN